MNYDYINEITEIYESEIQISKMGRMVDVSHKHYHREN